MNLSNNEKRLSSSRIFVENGNFGSPYVGTLGYNKRKLGKIINLNKRIIMN